MMMLRSLKNIFNFPSKFNNKFVDKRFSSSISGDAHWADDNSLFDQILNNNNPADPKMTHFLQNFGTQIRCHNFERPINKYQRIGLFGVKLGSSSMFLSKDNKCVHVTLIQIRDNIVLDRYIVESFNNKRRRLGILVAGVKAEPGVNVHNRTYANIISEKYNIERRRLVGGFYVDPDHEPKIGSTYGASFFRPDQRVRIISRTKDRGFLGVMQRWGFKGLPATHGVSLSHRHGGAVQGFKKTIYPGFKMPGHTGLKLQQNPPRRILRVNTTHDVIFIQGSIHGYKNGPLLVRDFDLTEWYEPPVDCPEDLYSSLVVPYNHGEVLNNSVDFDHHNDVGNDDDEIQEKLDAIDKQTPEIIEKSMKN